MTSATAAIGLEATPRPADTVGMARWGAAGAAVVAAVMTGATVVFAGVLPHLGFNDADYHRPAKFVDFVSAHGALFVSLSVACIVAAVALAVVVLAVHERVAAAGRATARLAAVFGYAGAGFLLLTWLTVLATATNILTSDDGISAADHAAFNAGARPFGDVMHAAGMSGAMLGIGLWAVVLGVSRLRRHLPTGTAVVAAVTGALMTIGSLTPAATMLVPLIAILLLALAVVLLRDAATVS